MLDAAIFAAATAPLLLIEHLPLADLPNHLASQAIVRNWSTSQDLQSYYAYEYAVSPNMAFELLAAATSSFLPLEAAARLFVVLTFALIFFGARLVNLHLGAGALRAYRFAPFLMYAGPFQFGFMNYWFGVGAALLGFGAWLRLRDRTTWQTVLSGVTIGAAVLTCHLASFGLFAIAVVSFELAAVAGTGWPKLPTTLPDRSFLAALGLRTLRATACVLPPLLLFALLSSTSKSSGTIAWSTVHKKIEAVAAITLFSSPAIELPLLVLALAGAGIGFWLKAICLPRAAWLMAVSMGLVFLALPKSLNGTTFLDYRIPSGACLFILACTLPGPATRFHRSIGLGFGVLAFARVLAVAVLWISLQPTLHNAKQAFRHLPIGARLAVVGQSASTSDGRRPPLWNLGGWAVVHRQAFVPHLFVSLGSLIRYQPAWAPFYRLSAPESASAIEPVYDYLLLLYPGHTAVPKAANLTLLARDSRFVLYKIDR